MINVIIYQYHPFCLQTAGVRPITSQRFRDIVLEKSDMFYIFNMYNFCRTTISYDFYRSSDISFRLVLTVTLQRIKSCTNKQLGWCGWVQSADRNFSAIWIMFWLIGWHGLTICRSGWLVHGLH